MRSNWSQNIGYVYNLSVMATFIKTNVDIMLPVIKKLRKCKCKVFRKENFCNGYRIYVDIMTVDKLPLI